MLSRAVQDKGVKPPLGGPTSRTTLAKQSPLPSGTRGVVSRAGTGTDGSIAAFCNPSARPPLSEIAHATSSRTFNSSQATNRYPTGPLATVHGSQSYGGFASLCHNSNSFAEVPDALDRFEADFSADPQAAAKSNSVPSVYIADDDLSDDDSLENRIGLDFEKPSVLPAPPPVRFGVISPLTESNKHDEAPSGSFQSNVSWSQSSPSHHMPPERQETHPVRQSPPPKREIGVVDPDATVPAAKKRVLPGSFTSRDTSRDQTEDSARNTGRAHSAGATGGIGNDLWEKTATAVKAQQKRHRDHQRKLTASGSDLSTEEIQNTAPAHTTVAPSKNAAASLSVEQQHVKSLVCDRNQSVFFTGPAGTGKSVLMRAIITELKKKWARDPDRLAVTASTGLAACNIGGMTLHSFAGIGLGKEDAQTLVKKIRRNPKAKNRWLRTNTLIIDEISMVDGELFDKLSQIGRTIRNNGRPWGGIKLVITGDFFQLPPVPDGGANKKETKFAFEAATWNTSIDHTIGLTEVFRQKDPEFAHMLNEMRLGRISDQTVQNFKSLSRPLHFDDGLEFTELFPTRTEVESSNQKRLKALSSEMHRFEAVDTGDPAHRERLLQNMMAPKSLVLKRGAQVMLIKNMDDTLVNGSLGTVVNFMSDATFQIMGSGDGYGSGDDEEKQDNGIDAAVKKRIQMFGHELEESGGADQKKYPLVRFHGVDGTARVLLCVPEEWKSELPTGEVQASRTQVPLILAWALSIHKAQGQTLERVKVDLGKVFEKGQAYVALSRATSQQGLQVLRFEKHKVMAHPRVIQFYDKLYSAESAMNKKAAAPALGRAGPPTARPYSRNGGRVVAGLAAAEQPATAMSATC